MASSSETVTGLPQLQFKGNGKDKESTWRQCELLGRGGFGDVYRANVQTDIGEVALAVKKVKVASTDDRARYESSVRQEVDSLKNLSHDRIISYFGFLATEKTFYIFIEYMPGGSLDQFIKKKKTENTKISEFTARLIARQLIEAVVYLHKKDYFHRDIKSANVLMQDEQNIKLADFGLTRQFQEITKTYTKAPGTFRFMAPEMIIERTYCHKVDIWAIGCVVVHMITLDPPFCNLQEQQVLGIFWNPKMTPSPANDIEHPVSRSCQNFFKKTFEKDPKLRPEASQLLNDDFISDVENDAAVDTYRSYQEGVLTLNPKYSATTLDHIQPSGLIGNVQSAANVTNIVFAPRINQKTENVTQKFKEKVTFKKDVKFDKVDQLNVGHLETLKADKVERLTVDKADKLDVQGATNLQASAQTVKVEQTHTVNTQDTYNVAVGRAETVNTEQPEVVNINHVDNLFIN